jgi:hypothetical protein
MTSPKFLPPKDRNPPKDTADCWKRKTWSKQMCMKFLASWRHIIRPSKSTEYKILTFSLQTFLKYDYFLHSPKPPHLKWGPHFNVAVHISRRPHSLQFNPWSHLCRSFYSENFMTTNDSSLQKYNDSNVPLHHGLGPTLHCRSPLLTISFIHLSIRVLVLSLNTTAPITRLKFVTKIKTQQKT